MDPRSLQRLSAFHGPLAPLQINPETYQISFSEHYAHGSYVSVAAQEFYPLEPIQESPARSDPDAWSSRSRVSSHGSVDSVLVEHFVSSDSNSGPSEHGMAPSIDCSKSSIEGGSSNRKQSLWSRGINIGSRVSRIIAKRRAKKLLVTLIATNDYGADHSATRQRRSEAATGLMKIAKEELSGENIVARRFLKTPSRWGKGAQALLKLSDDELDAMGYRAVHPVLEPTASMKLLDIVRRREGNVSFFGITISNTLEIAMDGAAAILYLALTEMESFFRHIDEKVIFSFCKRVIDAEATLCPKWYCGVKLLYALFLNARCHKWKDSYFLPPLLSNMFGGLILQAQRAVNPDVPMTSGAFENPQLLPLVARCCEEIETDSGLDALPPPETLKPFIELLISIILPEGTGQPSPSLDRGFALRTLIPLLKSRAVVGFIPTSKLPGLGVGFMEMALRPHTVGTQVEDGLDKDIFRPRRRRLDEWAIISLSRLPEPIFSNALSLALNKGIARLDYLAATPYEPLGLVERLLWISNIKVILAERAHQALVDAGACGFLAHVISWQSDAAPQDRGIWRAKGLALTCLGNLVERMDARQCRTYITKEIIEAVVAIKEHGEVPLVQKGQAIFTLQRYTLTAERWSIQTYYREDTASIAEEYRTNNEIDLPS
ncbi:hypothetical protein M407DRAFT_225909 [Tulasnella calospora MUT 4182]|uniref:Uncharacterized protein n=1 Tax=Tulasnella calospora MUT 4182 TaxID=1051891 RepID=A0A0C3KA60_9AGAM|nr:hypothetical protein M407DRAFT_228862 [Tulasnella calospora MUT 4182]KIO18308.1 hypothetical protein M407DRAFT_225909 [Tulasnella calospora MUT 4182]